jgi:hypothetical protein
VTRLWRSEEKKVLTGMDFFSAHFALMRSVEPEQEENQEYVDTEWTHERLAHFIVDHVYTQGETEREELIPKVCSG